ncbi:jg22063 [Pararge aegeria aegeria]|uniref:Jg22063 protein n=1 Tax=Pararge aegeria aegeria TaxID=348720 RepID=A0A8S4RL95_9NEOP|nr:jg22063 [Pararge aegeria aegeria]
MTVETHMYTCSPALDLHVNALDKQALFCCGRRGNILKCSYCLASALRILHRKAADSMTEFGGFVDDWLVGGFTSWSAAFASRSL